MSNPVIHRALISVSDKKGLISFARALRKQKIEILSTGGTLKVLQKAGIAAQPVESVTRFPEILEGRVKTLHPAIHGGLLYRRDKKEHREAVKEHHLCPIDLVVVNLYPFEEVTRDASVNEETAIENIDIGGPSMLRSAAKNFDAVTVVCDPADYDLVLDEIKKNEGCVSAETRRKLAQKTFERTSQYDRAIQHYFAGANGREGVSGLPEKLDVVYKKKQILRYGENPHQRAALYTRAGSEPRFQFEQLHGKELSYNNLLDIDATIDILREFEKPAACVVKHSNPCGIAESSTPAKALEDAIECDSLSAFGGILGINRPCNKHSAASALERLPFFEVIIAPSFDAPSLKLLKARKNLRIIATGSLGHIGPYDLRFLKSGILLQDRDRPIRETEDELHKRLRVVTKSVLKPSEIDELIFAWKCVKVVKSNAIVITQGKKTVGIGAGQMSRVDSVQIACQKASFRTEGGYLASDAFFPMPDSIEVASEYKIRAIIQPGGSIRDGDVIAACDRFGIAMALTGQRHFRH